MGSWLERGALSDLAAFDLAVLASTKHTFIQPVGVVFASAAIVSTISYCKESEKNSVIHLLRMETILA